MTKAATTPPAGGGQQQLEGKAKMDETIATPQSAASLVGTQLGLKAKHVMETTPRDATVAGSQCGCGGRGHGRGGCGGHRAASTQTADNTPRRGGCGCGRNRQATPDQA